MQAKQIHKQTPWNNIPLKLPDLNFNNIILIKVTEFKLTRSNSFVLPRKVLGDKV